MQEQLRAVRKRVGRNVKALREAKRWSRGELAEKVGNTDKHIAQIERGETNVTINYLTRIAEHLSVDVSRLFVDPDLPSGSVYTITQTVFDQIDAAIRAMAGVRATGRTAGSSEQS